MIDYNKGKIYKIEPINSLDEGDVYYGSTTKATLAERMASHRYDYKYFQDGKRDFVSSYELFEKYGIENCQIYLIENYPCKTKDELRAREGSFIKNNKCVNQVIAGRGMKEWYQDNKERVTKMKREYYNNNKETMQKYKKEYKITHCDQVKKQNAQYYEKNKEIINEKHRFYLLNNKEKRKSYARNFYQENKVSILEKQKASYFSKNKDKIECACGVHIAKGGLNEHLQTKKHNDRMQYIKINLNKNNYLCFY